MPGQCKRARLDVACEGSELAGRSTLSASDDAIQQAECGCPICHDILILPVQGQLNFAEPGSYRKLQSLQFSLTRNLDEVALPIACSEAAFTSDRLKFLVDLQGHVVIPSAGIAWPIGESST